MSHGNKWDKGQGGMGWPTMGCPRDKGQGKRGYPTNGTKTMDHQSRTQLLVEIIAFKE